MRTDRESDKTISEGLWISIILIIIISKYRVVGIICFNTFNII